MLRSPNPDAMIALRVATSMSDTALDLALLRVGVLAPTELDEIRSVLGRAGAALRPRRNADGHCIIEVCADDTVVAAVHPDGRVEHAVPHAA